MSRIFKEIGEELGRLSVQGRSEVAGAIFGNGAYVPYGPGQLPPKADPEKGNEGEETKQAAPEVERVGTKEVAPEMEM